MRPVASRFFSRRSALPLSTCLCILLSAASLQAAEPPQTARYPIEQPSQGLAQALQAIGRQTGTSVLFEPQAVEGRMSRPVSGRLSPIEAIRAALRGSGMTAELMPSGAVVVKLAAPASAASVVSAALAASASEPARAVDRSTPSGSGDQRLAPGAEEEADRVPPQPAASPPEALTRMEVTGSRLKRLDAEGPAPVNVYTAKDIERSGQPSLERFLASLNEVSASTGEGGYSSTLGQGTVQLRGLPLGSTLVLINGRRVQAVGSSAGNFFNLNLIPTAAIERVEIVPVGSSAVYGGDALAGVVNVILKKAMNGQSLSARLGSGQGFGDGSLSLATGAQSREGSYLVMASYSRSTPLTMAERDFFRDGDYRRLGGPDARTRSCTPGTVSSLTSANLPGLNASFAAIPHLASGAIPKVSDFQATAGTEALCNLRANGNGYALVHGAEVMGVHGLAERQLAGSWSAFGELTLAKERLQAREVGLSLSRVTVGAANPFNPFGQAVSVTAFLGPENGELGIARQTRFSRALLGLRGELGGDWEAELTASTVQDRGGSQTFNATVNTAARNAALNASTADAALNPFTTGRAASEAVLRGIWSDTLRDSRGSKDQVAGLLRGTLLELPAGPVDAILGLETARDRYEVSIPGQVAIRDSRRNSAAFVEARLPLLRGTAPGAGAWSLASLNLAARRDHYTDFGSASTHQAGLELRPVRSLLLRASTATSFKPPTLLQTNVDDITYAAETFGLTDPARGGEAIRSGTVVRGTNQSLEPERGRARGVGLVWEPDASLGSRLSLTHWAVQLQGLIAVLPAQSVLNFENLFPQLVTRGPSVDGRPGLVTNIKLSEVNVGRVDSAGTDVDAAYSWRSDLGKWTLAAGATRTHEYRVVLRPGTPQQDRLGVRFEDFWAPRWKGRLSLGVEGSAWSLGMTSRYLGRYQDIAGSDRRLGDYWVHDLAGSLKLRTWWPDLLPVFKAATASFSVTNLLGRDPQFAAGSPYYDVTQADWRGRHLSVRLSLDW